MNSCYGSLSGKVFDLLGVAPAGLFKTPRTYNQVKLRKRSGGWRELSVPNSQLKEVQSRMNFNVLQRLPKSVHTMGFVPFRSIAEHAKRHTGKKCVIKVDIKDFFGSTSESRVVDYFEGWGWSPESIEAVRYICFHPEISGLPQGAPTSPALSNVVNLVLDRRLAGLARHYGGEYSRYADDMVFSFSQAFHREREGIREFFYLVRLILGEYGYSLNEEKTAVMSNAGRQIVTGVVVNQKAALPREIRRRIRAAEHRRKQSLELSQVTGPRPAVPMSAAQLHGWQAYQKMFG